MRAVREVNSGRAAVARVPRVLFVVAAFLAVFCVGVYVGLYKTFPYDLLRSAYRTLIVNLDFGVFGTGTDADRVGRRHQLCPPFDRGSLERLKVDFGVPELQCATRMASADAAASRVEFLAGDALADPVLVKGEVGTFLDHCPAPAGCLAVEYSRSGAVSQAWPFRPEEIARANIVSGSDYPYEQPIAWSPLDVYVPRISLYPNGDLLVVLHFHNSYPYGGGVARVAPDGRPRWYRKDYSHHGGHVVSENLALVPSQRLDRSRLRYQAPVGGEGSERSRKFGIECHDGKIRESTVNLIGGDGELLEQISILDAIIESRYAATFAFTVGDHCHPAHLNFVHVLGADAGGADGIGAGDLVASLRKLNAFAILDKDDRRLKRLVRGSFIAQHGVRHLDNARFIMFDNLGTDGVHGPSRLLIVDLATGEEITVFPNDATPPHLAKWFLIAEGELDISPDGRRALVADLHGARALEIRLADGRVLNVFRQVHDLSKLPGFPEALTANSWMFKFRAIYYANRWTKSAQAPSPDGRPSRSAG